MNRFDLTPDVRRNSEQKQDKIIIDIHDDINGTKGIRTKEELIYRMHFIIGIRDELIQNLINRLK